MVYTVKFESAGSTALIRKSFDVTLAFIFQIIFFHETPGILKICGAILISIAIIMSGLYNNPLLQRFEKMNTCLFCKTIDNCALV